MIIILWGGVLICVIIFCNFAEEKTENIFCKNIESPF